jgi:hypothetical protein
VETWWLTYIQKKLKKLVLLFINAVLHTTECLQLICYIYTPHMVVYS